MCPLAHLTLSSMPSLCSSDAQMTFPWWRRKALRSSRVKNTSLKSLERKWQQKTSEHFLRRRESALSQTKTTHSFLSTRGTQWTTVGLSVAWGKQRRQLDVCLGTYLRLIQHVGYLPKKIFQIFQIPNNLNVICQGNESTPCDPWTARDFNSELSTSNESCAHCLPDCEKVSYSVTHSAANFRKCDSRNLNLAPFCKLNSESLTLHRWLPTVLAQYTPPYPAYLGMSTSERPNYPGQMADGELLQELTDEDSTYDAYAKDIAIINFFYGDPEIAGNSWFLQRLFIEVENQYISGIQRSRTRIN